MSAIRATSRSIAKIPDVDVVVGGHSHTLLSNTDEKAEGPYPTMVDNPGGYKVPVVQAGPYSKYLGDLIVTFDDAGVVKSAKGDPILIDASVKPDEAVLARIKELAKPIEELKAKVIGKTDAPIDGSREILPRQGMRDGQPRRRRHARPRQGPGRDHRHHQWRRPARLDRRRRRLDGRSDHGAAVPEHGRDLPDQGRRHHAPRSRTASARSRKAAAASRRSPA